MFENLKKLYEQYGGFKTVVCSWYFWIAVFLSLISYHSVLDFSWTKIALGIIPPLTGFTIAAFAIVFAILGEEKVRKLTVPNEEGVSPISTIAASIGHAVFVQVTALTLAIAMETVDLQKVVALLENNPQCWEALPITLPVFFSYVVNFLWRAPDNCCHSFNCTYAANCRASR